MTKNRMVRFGIFLIIASLSTTVWAQNEAAKKAKEKPQSEEPEGEDENEGAEDENEDAKEENEDAEEENGADTEDNESESDVEDFEGDSPDLKAPENVELDMKALGEIDPEKDLAKGGMLDEDAIAAQAAEEWTERALDILELHGYFRMRPELYHKFSIRSDDALYDRPEIEKVTPENSLGADCRDKGSRASCSNNTLAGANLRFRLEPTLNISEEVRIKAQIDFLDNVMLGSTPRYWQNWGSGETSSIDTGRIQGFNMAPPSSDQAVVIRRAWGEVMTPLGQLRFGRMGDHWGLGMLHNAGNGLNQDYGDTVDRIMFAAKINDWLIAPAWDFPNEGVSASDASGRPFDVSQLDDAYQLVGIVAYKHDKEDQLAMIKRGDWVINTGLHFTYRWQVLSFEENLEDTALGEGETPSNRFYRRDMWAIIPDFWFQFLRGTFHLELEAAFIYGEVGNPIRDEDNIDNVDALTLIQYGGVVQADYGLLSDQLRIGLEFGIASGDKDVEGLRAPATFDQKNGEKNSKFTAFSFNPAYNTDLILYHHILGSVSQSYYFNAWMRYDFLKSAMGRKLGLQVDVIYSRAVFEKSTINNGAVNLGVELNAQAMYVSEDHFHAGIQYGVLFPLAAFKGEYDIDPTDDIAGHVDNDLYFPQTVQAIIGITY